jgi:DNA polymerase V
MSNDGQGISIHTGFPNAGDDARLTPLDLHALLVPQPRSTFLFTVEGDDWAERGIYAGDIVVIDRSLAPRQTDLVAWVLDDSFTFGELTAIAQGGQIWGVVTSVIHRYRQASQHE